MKPFCHRCGAPRRVGRPGTLCLECQESALQIPFLQAKAYTKSRRCVCNAIVIHYTAGKAAERTAKSFARKSTASTHFIIDRNPGDSKMAPKGIIQCVSVIDRAYHAGTSRLGKRAHVNNFSIGIDLANLGPLTQQEGYFTTWYKAKYPKDWPYPVRCGSRYWEPYTLFQYRMAAWLCARLMENFPIPKERIVGHSDVSPGRKIDPGPAWSWERFGIELEGQIERRCDNEMV